MARLPDVSITLQRSLFLRSVFDVIVADAQTLFSTVESGPSAFRNMFWSPKTKNLPFDFRAARIHFRITDDDLDDLFYSLSQAVIDLHGMTSAAAGLDALRPERSPPTEAEIEAAWEIHSETPEVIEWELYGPLKPQGYLDKLKAGARPKDILIH